LQWDNFSHLRLRFIPEPLIAGEDTKSSSAFLSTAKNLYLLLATLPRELGIVCCSRYNPQAVRAGAISAGGWVSTED
jgi:hypothetical protein